MSGSSEFIGRAEFLTGAVQWLGTANYAVTVNDATLDNDQTNALMRGLAGAAGTFVPPGHGLAALLASLVPSDAQLDQDLRRVLGGLTNTVDVLGIKQRATLTSLVCFIGADDRAGSEVSDCVAACVRAGNSLNRFWNEIRIQAVAYWLVSPSAEQYEDLLEGLADETRWRCKDWVTVVWDPFDVNGPRESWPFQPAADETKREQRWWADRFDFYGTAIGELLEHAKAAHIQG